MQRQCLHRRRFADPLAAARATAREIASKSPDAVRALKRLLNAAADANMAAILLAESKEQAALIGSPKQIEAVRAGVEKREPRFADPGWGLSWIVCAGRKIPSAATACGGFLIW